MAPKVFSPKLVLMIHLKMMIHWPILVREMQIPFDHRCCNTEEFEDHENLLRIGLVFSYDTCSGYETLDNVIPP